MGKAWNTTDFPTQAEDSQKNRFSIQKQIARLALDAYWGYQTRKLHTLSWTHPLQFLTRVCESSTHDLCILPLQICKVRCDWFLGADVTEIVLVARVRRRYFRRRQPTAGNTSAFAGYWVTSWSCEIRRGRVWRSYLQNFWRAHWLIITINMRTQINEFIIYVIRQQARADNLTICYRKKQMMSVFHASHLLLTMDFATTLST